MKTIILAGGVGTRLSEETDVRPKPMVEIGYRPILWHILKIYAHYGYRDFLIALGYKGEYIKRYMAEYASLSTNMTVDLATGKVEAHESDGEVEDWRVALIDTGRHTETGGRLLKLVPYLDGETFMMTFGDGVSDVNVGALVGVPSRTREAGDAYGRASARALWARRARSETKWPNFRRSLSSGRAGSTAASSSLSRAFSTTSTARTRTFSASRSNGSPPTDS